MNKLAHKLRYKLAHKLSDIFLKINFKTKIFNHAKKYRSDSENGIYLTAILNILKNQKYFENFKRNYLYKETLEHVSEKQGAEYLEVLKTNNIEIFNLAIKTVLLSDSQGNPFKFKYNDCQIPLSPTTLRYVKVASDLEKLFGKELGDVVEIGCGYGGQTLVNDQLLNVRKATLFDLPLVNKLIDRYLDAYLLRGAFKTTVLNKESVSEYDLVISNYAFSELPKELQLKYIDKVLSHCKKGYLTMNDGLGTERSIGKLSFKELSSFLPKFEILEEKPLTGQHNYIIVWGHDKNKARNHFVIKSHQNKTG